MEYSEGTGLPKENLILVHIVGREEMAVLVLLYVLRDRTRIETSSDAKDCAKVRLENVSARAGSFRKPAPVA